jgi:hypothetical protein
MQKALQVYSEACGKPCSIYDRLGGRMTRLIIYSRVGFETHSPNRHSNSF